MRTLPEGLYLYVATDGTMSIRDAQECEWLTFVKPRTVAMRGDMADWLIAVAEATARMARDMEAWSEEGEEYPSIEAAVEDAYTRALTLR